MTDELISFAQNKEDIVLNALLQHVKNGFYVDVGANHPVQDSVTKLFYLKGWSGINIEPLDDLHELLVADRPRDINLNLGISNRDDKLTIRAYGHGHGLSTFSKDMQEDYKKTGFFYARDYEDKEVPVTTLLNLLSKYAKNKKIDFMKIDVEGYEYEVIEGNDWDTFRPSVICIEADHLLKDWHTLLKKFRYTKIYFDGLNEYFVANENSKIKKDFSYPDMFVAPYVTWESKKQYIHLSRQIRQAELPSNRTSEQHIPEENNVYLQSPAKARTIIKNTLHFVSNQLSSYITLRESTIKSGKTVSTNKVSSLNSAQALHLLQITSLSMSQQNRSLGFMVTKSTYLKLKRIAKVVHARANK